MLLRYPVLLLALAAALALTACQAPGGSAGEPAPSPELQPDVARVAEDSPAASSTPQPEATEVSKASPTSTPEPESEATQMSRTSPAPGLEPPSVEGPGNADVEFVRAVKNGDGAWTFSVTVRHPDTGWEDYADGWDVVLPDGTVLKPDPQSPFTRLLLHPHENEQPFTRSQSGIVIPDDIDQVRVRAHDLVDGWGGQEVVVLLTEASGPNFEVQQR